MTGSTKARKVLAATYVGKYTPSEVMQVAMDYLHEKAMSHAKKIEELLRLQGADATEIRLHYETARKTREQMIDVASKLAPYLHPKLESIDVNQKTEHRFVIVAPPMVKDTRDFYSLIGKTEKAPIEATQKIVEFNKKPEPEVLDIDYDDPDNDPPLVN